MFQKKKKIPKHLNLNLNKISHTKDPHRKRNNFLLSDTQFFLLSITEFSSSITLFPSIIPLFLRSLIFIRNTLHASPHSPRIGDILLPIITRRDSLSLSLSVEIEDHEADNDSSCSKRTISDLFCRFRR